MGRKWFKRAGRLGQTGKIPTDIGFGEDQIKKDKAARERPLFISHLEMNGVDLRPKVKMTHMQQQYIDMVRASLLGKHDRLIDYFDEFQARHPEYTIKIGVSVGKRWNIEKQEKWKATFTQPDRAFLGPLGYIDGAESPEQKAQKRIQHLLKTRRYEARVREIIEILGMTLHHGPSLVGATMTGTQTETKTVEPTEIAEGEAIAGTGGFGPAAIVLFMAVFGVNNLTDNTPNWQGAVDINAVNNFGEQDRRILLDEYAGYLHRGGENIQGMDLVQEELLRQHLGPNIRLPQPVWVDRDVDMGDAIGDVLGGIQIGVPWFNEPEPDYGNQIGDPWFYEPDPEPDIEMPDLVPEMPDPITTPETPEVEIGHQVEQNPDLEDDEMEPEVEEGIPPDLRHIPDQDVGIDVDEILDIAHDVEQNPDIDVQPDIDIDPEEFDDPEREIRVEDKDDESGKRGCKLELLAYKTKQALGIPTGSPPVCGIQGYSAKKDPDDTLNPPTAPTTPTTPTIPSIPTIPTIPTIPNIPNIPTTPSIPPSMDDNITNQRTSGNAADLGLTIAELNERILILKQNLAHRTALFNTLPTDRFTNRLIKLYSQQIQAKKVSIK